MERAGFREGALFSLCLPGFHTHALSKLLLLSLSLLLVLTPGTGNACGREE